MLKLLFLLFPVICVCVGKNNEIRDVPTLKSFSETYSTNGILHIPYAEIHEPFSAWYDGSRKSRIDYYGGMAKTFQIRSNSQYGNFYKIVPVTTESVKNQMTCFFVAGSPTYTLSTQSVLPNITDYEYAGKGMINGFECDKWTKSETFSDKINKYTMWTQTKKNLRKELLIPVRFEMKGFNVLMGSHYDHYFMDYENFSTDSPPNDIFSLKNYTCQPMGTSVADHVYTFNPIREFVDNYDKHVHSAFKDFKKKHKKLYADEIELNKRLNIFRKNLRLIHSHNRKNLSYKLGVNHLVDRDELELKALRGKKSTPGYKDQGLPFPHPLEKWTEAPESIDWRLNGAVTPVKDQSVCGSCWSFGATGAMEGAYFLKNNKLLSFSEQALVDCSWGFGNNACDGGEQFASFNWAMKHGIPTEEAYGPYLGQDGFCHIQDDMEKIKIQGYVNVTPADPRALKLAIAIHGPVTVSIDAQPITFAFYSHGVYYDPSCGNSTLSLDHAVLAVGYGKLHGEEYWLIKNSWSNYWGNDGYILISTKDNNCGVLDDAKYVIV